MALRKTHLKNVLLGGLGTWLETGTTMYKACIFHFPWPDRSVLSLWEREGRQEKGGGGIFLLFFSQSLEIQVVLNDQTYVLNIAPALPPHPWLLQTPGSHPAAIIKAKKTAGGHRKRHLKYVLMCHETNMNAHSFLMLYMGFSCRKATALKFILRENNHSFI